MRHTEPPHQTPQRPKRRRIDPDDAVAVAADDSFPASDPPAWIELSVGRKRKKPAKPTSS